MAEQDRVTAEAEFDKWAEDWDLDLETDMDDPDSKSLLDDHKRRIVKGLIQGKLSIKDEEITLKTRADGSVMFKVPTGAAYMELDRAKDSHTMKKMHNFMAAMTGKTPSFFAAMDGRDIKICQAVVSLFMAG